MGGFARDSAVQGSESASEESISEGYESGGLSLTQLGGHELLDVE